MTPTYTARRNANRSYWAANKSRSDADRPHALAWIATSTSVIAARTALETVERDGADYAARWAAHASYADACRVERAAFDAYIATAR